MTEDCGNAKGLTFFDINGLGKLDKEPFQLYTCHSVASNMTVTERFATFRYCSLTRVYVRLGLTLIIPLGDALFLQGYSYCLCH